MPLTAVHPDLIVTSAEGIPQLLVEAKSQSNVGSLAAEWHQRGVFYNRSHFLLFVATDKFWLWTPSSVEPAYEGDTMPLVERYIDLHKVPLATVRGQAFESLIYAWLGSVIFKPASVLSELPAQRWLVDTGLHPLIYRGYIQWETSLV